MENQAKKELEVFVNDRFVPTERSAVWFHSLVMPFPLSLGPQWGQRPMRHEGYPTNDAHTDSHGGPSHQ